MLCSMAGAQTLALAQVASVIGRCYECGWGRANTAIEENTLDVAPRLSVPARELVKNLGVPG